MQLFVKSLILGWMSLCAIEAMEEESRQGEEGGKKTVMVYEAIHIHSPTGFTQEVKDYFKDRINYETSTIEITDVNEQAILLEWLAIQSSDSQNLTNVTTNQERQKKFAEWVKKVHPEYFDGDSQSEINRAATFCETSKGVLKFTLRLPTAALCGAAGTAAGTLLAPVAFGWGFFIGSAFDHDGFPCAREQVVNTIIGLTKAGATLGYNAFS